MLRYISLITFLIIQGLYEYNCQCEYEDITGGVSGLDNIQFFIGERIHAYKVAYGVALPTDFIPLTSRELSQAALGTVEHIPLTPIANCNVDLKYQWMNTNPEGVIPAPCCPTSLSDDNCMLLYIQNHLTALAEMTTYKSVINQGSFVEITPLNIESATDTLVNEPQFTDTVLNSVNHYWGASAEEGENGLFYISYVTASGIPTKFCGAVVPPLIPSVAPVTTAAPTPPGSGTTLPGGGTTLPGGSTTIPGDSSSSSTSDATSNFMLPFLFVAIVFQTFF